jgi:hypothetical protein
MGGPAQAPLVDLQLAAIGVIMAGAFAGACTGAGLRHGVIAGFLGALAVLGLASAGIDPISPVIDGLFWVFQVPPEESGGTQGMLTVAGAVFLACATAGWFGGQLMPPLAPSWMRTKLPQMA